jgi:hypothetical protein
MLISAYNPRVVTRVQLFTNDVPESRLAVEAVFRLLLWGMQRPNRMPIILILIFPLIWLKFLDSSTPLRAGIMAQ